MPEPPEIARHQSEDGQGPRPHDPPSVLARADEIIHPSMRTVGGVKRRSLVVPFFARVEFTSSPSRQASTSHPFAHEAHDVVSIVDDRQSSRRGGPINDRS